MSQSEQKFTRKNGSDRSLSDDFLAALRHSNEVFAAFKVHQMGSDMAAKLLDDNGHLKPFRQWLNDVFSISTHYCGAWLRTEYARRSYEPTTRQTGSPSYATRMSCPTSAGCRQHRLTLSPHTGSIGKRNSPSPSTTRSGPSTTPGDRWNCKCSLEQTDDPVNRPDDIDGVDPPQRGLENNPGKDGHTFSDNHPYFPDGCSSCPFNKGFKNRLKTVFSNASNKKHCFNCSKIDKAMSKAHDDIKGKENITPPYIETYKVSHRSMVYTSPFHGKEEIKENTRMANFLADKYNRKVYMLPRLDP